MDDKDCMIEQLDDELDKKEKLILKQRLNNKELKDEISKLKRTTVDKLAYTAMEAAFEKIYNEATELKRKVLILETKLKLIELEKGK